MGLFSSLFGSKKTTKQPTVTTPVNTTSPATVINTIENNLNLANIPDEDISVDTRREVSLAIDNQVESLVPKNKTERETLRLDSQKTWNNRHPNASIFEWSYNTPITDGVHEYDKPQSDFVFDGVIITKRLNTDGTYEIVPYIVDRVTGKNVADIVYHVDFQYQKAVLQAEKVYDAIRREHRDESREKWKQENFHPWLRKRINQTHGAKQKQYEQMLYGTADIKTYDKIMDEARLYVPNVRMELEEFNLNDKDNEYLDNVVSAVEKAKHMLESIWVPYGLMTPTKEVGAIHFLNNPNQDYLVHSMEIGQFYKEVGQDYYKDPITNEEIDFDGEIHYSR